jgi:peptide/nickel transport system ATP-binding protein/oligopeptide transport system ATP-binding protein
MTDGPVLEVEGLRKTFVQNDGLLDRLLYDRTEIQAVAGIDFELDRGETLGIVGESGCGKSTVARCLLRLDEPTAGTVRYDGTDLTALPDDAMKTRRREIQMVFQNPASSLNRRKTVAQTLKDPMEVHGLYEGEREKRVNRLLETVGLDPGQSNRYPHEFSGGQRQRIGIARALAVDPELLVLDEPVSALDVSIQAQILNLLDDLQDEFDLTLLVISHDLSVINYVCDRVAVMYLGEIMEIGPAERLFTDPQHPYTRSLLDAIPQPVPELARNRTVLRGSVPSPADPPSGCVFHPRCVDATTECERTDPDLEPVADPVDGHEAACLHVGDLETEFTPPFEQQTPMAAYSVERFKSAEDEPATAEGN